MSENPYQSAPSLPNPASLAAQQKPIGLTAIPVICLILGILGTLMNLWILIVLVFQDSFKAAQPANLAEYHEKLAAIQQGQIIFSIIIICCNFIIAPLLVYGAISVLKVKESGRNLLRNTLLFAIIFVVARGAYAIWHQFNKMSAMKELPSAEFNDPVMASAMQFSMVAGIVVGVIWAVGLVGFYVWSRVYLNKPSVRAFFDAAN